MTPFSEGIEILSPRARFLEGRGANQTSQFGEDGLIGACLETFGVANRWCFEVGAADGVFFSNTHRLRLEGWDAVLIEAEAEQYEKLRQHRSEKVRTVPKRIGKDSLDKILIEHGAPCELDLGVIDVDGQDWWVWKGLKDFRPRLVLIEFSLGSEGTDWFIPDEGGRGQATYKAIIQLGRDKQYEPLANTRCNILFVDRLIL